VVDSGETSSTSQIWAIEVQGLTKSFGNHLALKGVDLRVREGEFLTVFGPNGSGKTTLIKVLATLTKPSSGSVRVAGFDLRDSPVQIRRKIGVVSHQIFLYDDLTAFENLKFYGRMYDISDLEARIEEVVARVGLTSRLHHKVCILSRGMQQRFSIARAMLHRPSIMFLDEPETGLDQHATAGLRKGLDALSTEGGTVIMTTHRLEYGLEMGDRVAILAGGRIVYDESRESLDVKSLRQSYDRLTSSVR
jgi:heme ABC exporter ATP-binding subunit CcmA